MILNFGSINIDNVYRVQRMPLAGETISAHSFDKVLGGKGVNQSVAAQRAGGDVFHVGNVGTDKWIIDQLSALNVDTKYIETKTAETGHAIIFVDDDGENEIVIHPGANAEFQISEVEKILAVHAGDNLWVVLQNEINCSVEIAKAAKEMGCRVCYSAAPFHADHAKAILPFVDLLALNETELRDLQKTIGQDVSDLGVAMTLVTLGAQGAKLYHGDDTLTQDSFSVTAIDTTGAGDTFLGSFIARFDMGDSTQTALRYASAAAAIQVTRIGAAPAIPTQTEVLDFLNETT